MEKAFPSLHSIDDNWVKEPLEEHRGMSLRDYFAARAMEALIVVHGGITQRSGITENISVQAYSMADKMLEARNKNE